MQRSIRRTCRISAPSGVPPRLLWTCLLASLFWLGACGAESPGNQFPPDTTAPNDTGGDATIDLGEDESTPDVDVPDTRQDPDEDPTPEVGTDTSLEPGTYGSPCRGNDDCISGLCVAGAATFVCSQNCVDSCPPLEGADWQCRPIQNQLSDGVRACLPRASALCEPCLSDRNCPGGACIESGNGRICGLDCVEDTDCPDDTFCFRRVAGVDLAVAQCLPANGSCDCTAETDGTSRPCARSSLDGVLTCVGTEVCIPFQGWFGCDAALPRAEVCDGFDNDCNGLIDDALVLGADCAVTNAFGSCQGIEICQEGTLECQGPIPTEEVCDGRDNDCDGEIDETYRDEAGRYVTDDACGACGNGCADRFPDGYGSACEVVDAAATCVVTSCPLGYAPSGRQACVPLDSALCQGCGTDADCNPAVGDACVSYGAASFCGRACGTGSPFGPLCPDGYSCREDIGQCVLEAGTCDCRPGDSFFLSCRLTSPSGDTCAGRRACEDGALGACIPPADLCDGIDNDCDGTVDEGFVDASGGYTTPAHCGVCFNDCNLALPAGSRATGICQTDGARPRCSFVCDDGFVDADGLAFNGCECQRTSADDPPDVAGIDADCDGIDGQVARGVFVATTGSDANDGTRVSPLRTITAGIARAQSTGRDHVYVGAGVYDESVVLANGISLFGGYGTGFATRNIAGNETAIVGVVPTTAAPGALVARDLTAALRVDGFTIVGANALAAGTSSYAVWIRNTSTALSLTNNNIRAGVGAAGSAGGVGANGASATVGQAGFAPAAVGQAAVSARGDCPASPLTAIPGGSGAQFTCATAAGNVSTNGGNGGTSGCPVFNTAGPSGLVGSSQPGVEGGAGGIGGYSLRWGNVNNLETGLCNGCFVPNDANATIDGRPGTDGRRGASGGAGAGCPTTIGTVAAGVWQNGNAQAGGVGGPGSGGGGGGAGGGTQNTNQCQRNQVTPGNGTPPDEALGGGGGGGGAGGCGGRGGAPGSTAGGSFGVFLSYATAPTGLPTIRDNRIFRGRGGDGGAGGPGGEGGLGSPGETGTISLTIGCAGTGGQGGAGGPGGPGGGGGGGCAGPAVGIWVGTDAGPLPGGVPLGLLRTGNQFPAGGAAGTPGQGGASAGVVGGNAAPAPFEAVLPCPTGGAPPCE